VTNVAVNICHGMQAGDQDTFFLGTKAYVHAGNSFSPEISFETLWTLHIVEQVGSSMAALKLLGHDVLMYCKVTLASTAAVNSRTR